MDSAILNGRGYSFISAIGLAVIAVGAVRLAMLGRAVDAAVFAALVALAILFMMAKTGLPRIFTALFLIACAVNAAGYVFTLWHEETAFDETVHAFTSFTIAAAAGWYLVVRNDVASDPPRQVAMITAIGLVVGVLWEIFEWAIGIIGTRRDTIIDLVMDIIGSVAAGMFCAWAASRHQAKAR